jgi:hypothetical protein
LADALSFLDQEQTSASKAAKTVFEPIPDLDDDRRMRREGRNADLLCKCEIYRVVSGIRHSSVHLGQLTSAQPQGGNEPVSAFDAWLERCERIWQIAAR